MYERKSNKRNKQYVRGEKKKILELYRESAATLYTEFYLYFLFSKFYSEIHLEQDKEPFHSLSPNLPSAQTRFTAYILTSPSPSISI